MEVKVLKRFLETKENLSILTDGFLGFEMNGNV